MFRVKSHPCRFVAIVFALVGCFGSAPLQGDECYPEGADDVLDLISEQVDVMSSEEEQETTGRMAVETPLAAPSSDQISAPSPVKTSTSLVNGAGIPSLLGLAVDSGLIQGENGAITVSLSPFTFLAMAKPEVLWYQSQYEEHRELRRFGGSVTFGGKGEAFDRDGDGEVDEALEAKELGDIVTWELRVRLGSKTRDRRDRENFAKFAGAVRSIADRKSAAISDFWSAYSERFEIDNPNSPSARCYGKQRTREMLEEEEIKARLSEIRQISKEMERAAKSAADEIDRQDLWTLVVGGTERGEEFGPDSLKVGVRGSLGNSNLNLEWSRTEDLMGGQDTEVLKGAYEYSRLLLQGSPFLKDGITASAAATYEYFDNVPDAPHDTIAKLGVKLEYPLGEGLSLPISVTWANHADLLTDEEEVRGHIGFTVNLGKLLSPQNLNGSSQAAGDD